MSQLPPPLIVAIDDEPDDLFFLRRTIEKTGLAHEFQTYSNGEAGMMALSTTIADENNRGVPLICFLDIKMGPVTGFELLRWVRQQKALDALPVIMYSSSDHPSDVEQARELGAQGFLKKYPAVDAMRTVLDEAIDFALAAPPKKTFVQWSYRFVDATDAVLAK